MTAVFAMIMDHRPWIEGVTFSGGEPFDQALALASLAVMLKGEGLTIMAYSGYPLPEIFDSGNQDRLDLLDLLDILVDGPYRHDLRGTHAWKGSDNQIVRYFNMPTGDSAEHMGPRAEIVIDRHGDVSVTGMLAEEARESLRCLLGRTQPH